MRWAWRGALLAAIVAVGVLGWAYWMAGLYGVNIVIRRGGSYWTEVSADARELSPAMRLALRDPVPAAHPGVFAWQSLAPGLDVAELPVLVDGTEVDRLLLTRLDPARFRIVVRNAPAGHRELGDWMRALGAAFVINGSYYDRYGRPDTPTVIDGAPRGPETYDARHGALVLTDMAARIENLARQDWRPVLAGAAQGFVSYPLLLAPDAAAPARSDPRWLANRSFVGLDAEGRLVFGTTADAFFSLARLSAFLAEAPLGLISALNLDGGPVACQGVQAAAYRRDFCGVWETSTREAQLNLLRWPLWWRRFGLPVVIAALPR